MADIACITASILFFLLAIAYTTGCERLALPRTATKAKP
jgi:hypothetical protein